MALEELSLKIPKISELGYSQTDIQEAIAAFLHHRDILSLKEARQMIGKSRREFEEDVLPKFDFATYGDDPKDAEIELAAARR